MAVDGKAALPTVAAEWERRAASEYASAAHAQTIGLWLTEIGASPDLIGDSIAIAAEELDHSSRCLDVARAAGGGSVPTVAREALRLPETDRREIDVLREVLRLFCLGETLAVAMFNGARRQATEPIARQTLEVIVRDEVGHRAFGWDTLDWFIERRVIAHVESVVAEMLVEMTNAFASMYAVDVDVDVEPVGPAERAWGLTPVAAASGLVDRALTHDWPRRFARRNIEWRHTPCQVELTQPFLCS